MAAEPRRRPQKCWIRGILYLVWTWMVIVEGQVAEVDIYQNCSEVVQTNSMSQPIQNLPLSNSSSGVPLNLTTPSNSSSVPITVITASSDSPSTSTIQDSNSQTTAPSVAEPTIQNSPLQTMNSIPTFIVAPTTTSLVSQRTTPTASVSSSLKANSTAKQSTSLYTLPGNASSLHSPMKSCLIFALWTYVILNALGCF